MVSDLPMLTNNRWLKGDSFLGIERLQGGCYKKKIKEEPRISLY